MSRLLGYPLRKRTMFRSNWRLGGRQSLSRRFVKTGKNLAPTGNTLTTIPRLQPLNLVAIPTTLPRPHTWDNAVHSPNLVASACLCLSWTNNRIFVFRHGVLCNNKQNSSIKTELLSTRSLQHKGSRSPDSSVGRTRMCVALSACSLAPRLTTCLKFRFSYNVCIDSNMGWYIVTTACGAFELAIVSISPSFMSYVS
jgi:hypothetical protein